MELETTQLTRGFVLMNEKTGVVRTDTFDAVPEGAIYGYCMRFSSMYTGTSLEEAWKGMMERGWACVPVEMRRIDKNYEMPQ